MQRVSLFIVNFLFLLPLVCLSEVLTVSSIEISGNHKTKSSVILRELKIRPQDKISLVQIDEGISRLKRTGLFSTVTYQLIDQDLQNKQLVVQVTEKWTTIPILKVNSGGGVSQYTVGVYDPNIFGEYLEAGLQYENLEGAGSGVVWFKNPRFLGQDQGIDLQYWNTKRIRIKYDQETSGPNIKNGFLQEREKIYADYFKEFAKDKIARISIDYNKDQFSTRLLSDEVLNEIGSNLALPPETELFITKLGLEFGSINGDPQSLSGSLLGFYFGYAEPLNSKVESFVQGDISFNYYKPVLPDWQLAQRILIGSTTTDVLQYWHYLGGLDRIRGFADNRFSARHYGLSNSEIRYLFMQKPSFLIQTIGFLDFAMVADQFSALNQIHAASVGTGVRIILPKFYRFVVRLDYAKPIIKNDTMNLSLGVQQFF